MNVLAFDPGQTTGFCMLKNCEGQHRVYSLLEAGQIVWERRLFDVNALLTGIYSRTLPRPDVLVIESFILRPGRAMEQVGSTFPSVQVIGIIEGIRFTRELKIPMVMQTPSCISRVQILEEHQDRLKGMVHAQDAYRHARYYLARGGL
jgi:hypothetical protein